MNNYIGLNIKHLCVKNKIAQKEFGELFDQKPTTINTYISGRSNPNVETIQKICKHFDISIDDFININLEEKGYINNAVITGVVKEPQSSYGNEFESKLIAAKDKIIEGLEKQIVIMEKQIGYLERDVEKLQHKAS